MENSRKNFVGKHGGKGILGRPNMKVSERKKV
jgi:hypothetical protein